MECNSPLGSLRSFVVKNACQRQFFVRKPPLEYLAWFAGKNPPRQRHPQPFALRSALCPLLRSSVFRTFQPLQLALDSELTLELRMRLTPGIAHPLSRVTRHPPKSVKSMHHVSRQRTALLGICLVAGLVAANPWSKLFACVFVIFVSVKSAVPPSPWLFTLCIGFTDPPKHRSTETPIHRPSGRRRRSKQPRGTLRPPARWPKGSGQNRRNEFPIQGT